MRDVRRTGPLITIITMGKSDRRSNEACEHFAMRVGRERWLGATWAGRWRQWGERCSLV